MTLDRQTAMDGERRQSMAIEPIPYGSPIRAANDEGRE